MKNRRPNEALAGSDHANAAYVFRLYLAGGAPNSVRALANLYAICQKYFPASHRIEVIDVLKEPLRALADAILVTPTVVKVSPAPELQIIGNLSEEEEVPAGARIAAKGGRMIVQQHPLVARPTPRAIHANVMALGLAHAESALHALTSGQIDAIVDPDGNTYLLRPAQEHLRRNEARLQALLESIPDVVTVLDRTGEVKSQSPTVTRVLGYEPDELVGRSFFDFVHPDDLNGFTRTFTEAIEGVSSSSPAEFRHRARDGAWRPLEAMLGTLGPVESPTVTITFHDTTHRQVVKEEFAQREAASTQGLLDRDRFLAMLVHELRTPLTPALLGICELQENPDLAGVHETLTIIQNSIEWQSRLIEELMDYVSIGQHKLHLQIEPIDAHEAVRLALEFCRSDITAARTKVLLYLQATDNIVLADALKLQQVLWNLLRNAAKFSPPGGSIFITSANESPGKFTIEIADQGIGIEPEFLPFVFDAYQQGGQSQQTHPRGLGLGMFIAKGLVEAQQGTLTVSSGGPGRGTKFRMCFANILLTPDPISSIIGGGSHSGNGAESFPKTPSPQTVG